MGRGMDMVRIQFSDRNAAAGSTKYVNWLGKIRTFKYTVPAAFPLQSSLLVEKLEIVSVSTVSFTLSCAPHCIIKGHKLGLIPFSHASTSRHIRETGLRFEQTRPDTHTFTQSRSSLESLQIRDVYIQAFTAHHLRSFDSACDPYICVQRLSHHPALLCHFHPVSGTNLSPRKLEKICGVCVCLSVFGGDCQCLDRAVTNIRNINERRSPRHYRTLWL